MVRRVLIGALLLGARALIAENPPQAVAALEHLKPKTEAGPFGWTTGAYLYDAAGNIKNIGDETFVYDKVGRLRSATVRGPDLTTYQTQTFTYDQYGNLTATSRLGQTVLLPAEATTNRLATVTYDPAGNVITSGAQHYDYDALGMLNAIRIGTSQQPRIVYAYTANDERLFAFDVAANTTRWTVRGLDNRVLRDFRQEGGTWSVDRDYIYRDGLLLAALKSGGDVEHYSLDHLGTPRLITDAAGHKIGDHVYWPFGEEWTPGNAQEGAPLEFTGHERDADPSGGVAPLDYMHARFYQGGWGRFLTVDPATDAELSVPQPQRWNRYSYVLNNPMKSFDPDGRSDVGLDCVPASVCTPEVKASIRQAQIQGVYVTGVAVGAVILTRFAPSAASALSSWALLNPGQAVQVADAVLSPPGASALPASLAEETFNQALVRESEKLAGFTIDGTKGMIGSTFNRNILYLSANAKGSASIGGFFKAIESEAKAAGANRVSIVGLKIINAKLFNAVIAKRYGYTLRVINSETVQLTKDIH